MLQSGRDLPFLHLTTLSRRQNLHPQCHTSLSDWLSEPRLQEPIRCVVTFSSVCIAKCCDRVGECGRIHAGGVLELEEGSKPILL